MTPSTILSLASILTAAAACHPGDPGPCKPGEATFSTLNGSVSVVGGLDQPFDVTDAEGTTPCSIKSRPSGSRNADAETRTTIDLTCINGDENLDLTFEIDDTRILGAGTHDLSTDEYGLRISYQPSASSPRCYTYLGEVDYTMTVSEAVGDMLPYPTLVTGDFHRRLAISLDLTLNNRRAKQYTNGVVEDCSLDFIGAFQFTAELDATDFIAKSEDSCIFE